MSLFPILFIGGALAVLTRKKRRRRTSASKALPAPAGRGTIYSAIGPERPDMITASVGDRFSMSIPASLGNGFEWSLSASPADNSINHVKTERDEVAGATGSPDGKNVYIFEGTKPGKGSLVFHLQAPWLEGKQPPTEIVEILTEIL